MRGYARQFGEDEEDWGVVGAAARLRLRALAQPRGSSLSRQPRFSREKGYPEWVVRAILSHADYSGVPREGRLEKTLFACDEMAGFVTAASLVRPSKSVLDLEPTSVVKRMKDKAFATRREAGRSACRRRTAGPPARGAHPQRHRLHARARRRAGAAWDACNRHPSSRLVPDSRH